MTAVEGPLSARLRVLCERAVPHLDPAAPAAEGLAAVAARLAEPTLRLAVGGRLKAGKSTLVNALLGHRLAATAATECTLLVAWFRDAHVNRVQVRHRDGGVRHVPARPGGGVPDDPAALGIPHEEIAELVVEAPNERLASGYTVVDTPGLDSLTGLDDLSMAALARADALLYVTPHPGENDLEALEALRRRADEHITALNVLGVLSRVDELGDGIGDPWPRARRVAARYGDRLSGVAARVVPVAGLLAETVLGDHYTDADTASLLRLAAADPAELDEALFSSDTFTSWSGAPITGPARERLLGLLGRYGVEIAVTAVREGGASTAEVLAVLRRHSGVDDLLDQIRDHFGARADRLRAASAAALLEEVCALGRTKEEIAALMALRSGLADLRRHPLMRQTALAAALATSASGGLVLPDDDHRALIRLAAGHDAAACLGAAPGASPADLRKAADEEIRRWQSHEWSHSRVVRRHAQTARELCEAFYFLAEEGSA
ncbi:dynamin family protein [Actinomadura rugatobispora]|uniref:Dynamin family protein n=1 Tax=Actinomadura rugatobispora TaxID=1994 RepID=A0ABW1A809_9ACTN|nr:dynamin family protein [Actinomadura rugatobispora]